LISVVFKKDSDAFFCYNACRSNSTKLTLFSINQQELTYMKLAGIKTGLLINFNVTKLKDGIKRYVL